MSHLPPPTSPRNSEPRSFTDALPAWVLGGLIVLLFLARAAEAWRLPMPQCTFRMLTGWPCAFCGSTRAAFAAARFEFLAAFRLNPLTCLLGAGVVLAFLAWVTDRCLGTSLLEAGRRRLSRWPWMWVGAFALLVNWAYLLLSAGGR